MATFPAMGLRSRRILLRLCFLLIAPLPVPTVASAQFCGLFAQPRSLRERIAEADVALIARLEGPIQGDGENRVRYAVHQICKGTFPGKRLVLDPVVLSEGIAELVLVFGLSLDDRVEFETTLPVDMDIAEYVLSLPTPETPDDRRIAWYSDRLFHKNHHIALDSLIELGQISFAQLREHHQSLPRDRLHAWLADYVRADDEGRETLSKTYLLAAVSLMLAACTDPRDEPLFRRLAFEEPDPSRQRLGQEDVLFAYMFLAGEEGVRQLLCERLQRSDVPFIDTYELFAALRKLRSDGEARIADGVFREAFGRFLHREELHDVTILQLAEIEDWSQLGPVFHMYNDLDPAAEMTPTTKRAIVRYLLTAAADVPDDAAPIPDHARQARKFLAFLSDVDPTTVEKGKALHGISLKGRD